ncbi:MAG: hypothetical protein DDT42_00453 [candidate division WS2 bacterium]|uniref:Phage terminase large subunit n=1 Tax=Psychracetigena formicireducens TaxID=2986056 RepID=A0A9E2F441_PSYF1|nr:hypothetical protein [Candidatus Psychracetigena formicireducens]
MEKRQVKVNKKNFDFLRRSKKRINILFGGAGSGKSHATAQFLLLKMYAERDIRILITMKTRPALKKAAWLLVNDLIKKYELPIADRNKSDLTITVNNNQMFFVSLDDPEKLKSFERINYIWGEEFTQNTRDDYLQLNLRCRGVNKNGLNQLYFSFNPVDEQSFLKSIVENPPDNVGVQHSTYKDNEFLEDDYIRELEGLKEQDETYHKIYTLGIWATPINLIYTNWDIIDKFPEVCDDIGYGLDFGYTNESALVKIGIKDGEVYEEELLYQTKLTNADLIEQLKILIPDKSLEIKADSAEPQRIEEIFQAGFNIHPCIKVKGSVGAGIDKIKSKRIHITKDSVNLIKEKQGYKWKTDKNGNIIDGEPVKFRDHLMSAERYYLGEAQITEHFIGSKTKREEFMISSDLRW